MKPLFLVALVSLASSCGGKQAAKNIVREPSLASDSLVGGCEDLMFLPLSASVAMHFGVTEFSRTMYGSLDGSCGTRDVEVTYSGSYSIDKQTAEQKKIDASPIDLTYNKVVVKPLSDAGRDVLNNIPGGFCGHQDWKTNQDIDLTTNSTETTCPLIDLPEVQYDLVSTKDSSVRFGATGVKSAPSKMEQRPTELKGMSFNKQ